ncbi:MAG: hypothetical protein V7609_2122 [Verrucomicrobiota bacterium]
MSIEITDAQFLEMTRIAIAEEVAASRDLIRHEIIEEFKWVTDATGVTLLEIEGKDPLRTFRRLMNSYGVEMLKLGGQTAIVRYRWKKRPVPHKDGRISIEELIEKHAVKAAARSRGSSKDQSPSSREAPNPKLQVMEGSMAS